MLPVGVNPNTQIMGSNCEGSEPERAKLLPPSPSLSLSLSLGSGVCIERGWRCRRSHPLAAPEIRGGG